MSKTELGGDAVIDGKRYALYKESTDDLGNPILGWRRTGSEPVQATTPQDNVLTALWDEGWAGGMGATDDFLSRLSEVPGVRKMGDAYWHSTGWDAHMPGRARLHGRRVTVQPATSPGDLPTHFFEKDPASSATFSVSNFTTDGDTEQTVTHGLSVAPKAIIFWTAGQTASGTVGAGTFNSIGITDISGTSAGTSRAAGWNSEDNVGTSNTGRQWAVGVVCLPAAAGTAGPIATITASSVGATTFGITWDVAPASGIIIHFQAIGGEEVSASVDTWTMSATTKSVTGVGFQPTVCFHITAALASASAAVDAVVGFGAMDASGNQWCHNISSGDNLADTVTARSTTMQRTTLISSSASAFFVSMDADGFTVGAASTGTSLVATLSLRGIQAKAGFVTKKTSAGNQTAASIGFTTTAFFLASTGTATGAEANAVVSIGAASGTTAVEASCWTDEDSQATSDTYAVDDNALAFEILDLTDGSEDSLATCGNINMETAGWLTWSAASASEELITYIAFAQAAGSDNDPFICMTNGQRCYIMDVSSNVITVTDEEDFLAGTAGFGCEFEGKQYIPLGKSVMARTLDSISQAGVGTFTTLGYTAVAFEVLQDGPTSRIMKGFSTSATGAANFVNLSSDGTTYAPTSPAYEVGDSSDDIVKIVDSGARVGVGKQKNLWLTDGSTGASEKVTSETKKSSSNGVATLAWQGTEAFMYNHGGVMFFFDGSTRPQDVGIGAVPFNRHQPNVTGEPHGGTYYETHIHGNWAYALYRVTESGTTYTYVEVRRWLGDRWVRHTYDRLAGVARGMFFDSSNRLWFAWPSAGLIGYYLLNGDGSPDAGNNNIGFGDTPGTGTTAYDLWFPESNFGMESTVKQGWQLFANIRGLTAQTTFSFIYQVDGGTVQTLGGTTTSGIYKAHFTLGSNDTGVRWKIGVRLTVTTSYDDDSTTPVELREVGFRMFPRPDKQQEIEIAVDTGAIHANGEVPEDGKKVRDDLAALVSGQAVAATDPDGNSLTMRITDIEDFKVRLPNEEQEIHYVVRLRAVERTTPS